MLDKGKGQMHIKIVKEYSESYCELVVTDNYKSVICVCDFLPNEKNEVLLSNTKISMLNAFFLDENPKINLVKDDYDFAYCFHR